MVKIQMGLTNNQLKIIAMAAMLLDHVGKVLLPKLLILQIIGRLAFPIFAYMIAEGCRYTRNRGKYLLNLAGLAAVCAIVFFVAKGSLYQSVLVTFSLAVITIFALEYFRSRPGIASGVVLGLELLALVVVCFLLPDILRSRGFGIDYGFIGVCLPVAVYFAPGRREKLLITAALTALLGYDISGIQWFGLLALPVLALYNGQRGKANLKLLFYIFYPCHLAVIYGISLLIKYCF